ncbi:hypothetical protein [Amnibacterium kyonggiense]
MAVRSSRLLALVLIALGAVLVAAGVVVLAAPADGPAPVTSCAPATEECEMDLALSGALTDSGVAGPALVLAGCGSALAGAVVRRRRPRRGVERA